MAKAKNRFTMCEWDGKALVPYSEADAEDLAHLKAGARYRVDVASFRSVPRWRLFHGVLRAVIENHDHFTTVESLRDMLLVACGVTKPFWTIDGELQLHPCSTSFYNMDEAQFRPFFDKALELISTKILPGVDINELLAEGKRKTGWKDA